MNTKREPEKTLMDQYLEDPEFAKLMAQGDLIMEVTETLCELLEKEKVSRKELADRLGKSKGFVSQLLNGGRNLTLRTLADILHALGYKVALSPYKEAGQRLKKSATKKAKRQPAIAKKEPARREKVIV
ncbi:MAG: helix-turn-helix domain-containing protein [Desulfobaccales bacterium]|jgi:transcriptional regulator with XRE-family HTH domain